MNPNKIFFRNATYTKRFTALSCVATSVLRMRLLHAVAFKEITLVDSNQGNYFENATACSKRMRKTLVATQLYLNLLMVV